MPEPTVSILLPCYSSYQLFNKVFPMSLREIKIDSDFELIMYNNGGGFEKILNHPEFIAFQKEPTTINKRLSRVEFIGDGNNIGLNRALNECAREARGKYYFLPHVDMFMLPNCLQSLIDVAKNQAPASFLLCSRSIEPTLGHTKHHIIEDYGKEPSEFNNDEDGPKKSKANQLLAKYENYKNYTIEVGARMPFFMHKSLWSKMANFNIQNKIGIDVPQGPSKTLNVGVDPTYFSYCTDDDLIQTAYAVGVRKYWMVYDSLVYHLQGKSNNQQKVDKDSDAPYRYFVDKWKKRGYPDAAHPGIWHNKIIPFYTKVR